MSVELKTAGTEFVKSVLTLYRTAKYFREKEILSNKLLDCSIEAGRLVTELSDCPDKQKSQVASDALEQLNRALFLVGVMQSENIYSSRRTQPVYNVANPLKEEIKKYIVFKEEPPVQMLPLPEELPEKTGEQLRFSDSGGFNEPYKG